VISRSRSQVFVWSLFDLANTSFSVLIVAVGYSLYFREIVVGGTGRGDFYWGLAVSISMLITALIAPVLGAASDLAHLRKRFLFYFTSASIFCTSLLYLVNPGMILTGMILFILANVGFEGGIVFYNAFLPQVAEREHYGRISGFGFAMGYVGSLLSLLMAIPLFEGSFAEENLSNVRLSFLLAAGMFALFAAPLFIFLKTPPIETTLSGSPIRKGYARVRETLSHLRSYNNITRFLLAFFLYNDGILTVISFASIFAAESLKFSLQEILLLFALVQASAIVGSLVLGFLTDRIGAKRTIGITLVVWIAIIIAAIVVESKEAFYAVGVLAGIAMGGSQSASRSLMALLTPPDREAEFFGFYDGFCGKASAVIGTFLFGTLSWLTGNQRVAIGVVGLFFVAGLLLLQKVDSNRT